ncbi:LysR family transcriptional regulator [Photobacterium swingsii]|uniref:LysR family transcriptional regulator n=1 Tax=Photobacterium swingsii TaxID=680026 RepID=UPI003D0F3B1A
MRHLKSFHVFHVAATSATFSEAASKLNITHGAVSKQIKVLEAYLAHPLFVKQGRNVMLTKEGILLKGYTEQAFQALETGVAQLSQLKNQHLEVSCEPTLTMRWLMPRLSDFHHQTGTDVRLSTAGGPVNLGVSGLSMAIRRDDFELEHDYRKTHLVDEWVGPVFSPDYWDKVKNDLSSIKKLSSLTRPHAWNEWMANYDGVLDFGQTHQDYAHFYFCFQAAVDGLGAAIGSYPLVVDDLKRGNLIAPFGFMLSGHRYILLSEDKTMSEHSVKDESEAQFTQWLKDNLSCCEPRLQEQTGLYY